MRSLTYDAAMVGKAGLGTLTMDGNTRLCTAGAAAAMREVSSPGITVATASDVLCTSRSVVMDNQVSLFSGI